MNSFLSLTKEQDLIRWKSFCSQYSIIEHLWENIISVLPDAPLPEVNKGREEGVQYHLCWNGERFLFELDLNHNNTYDWFFLDRTKSGCEGTDIPEPELPLAAIKTYLSKLIPPSL